MKSVSTRKQRIVLAAQKFRHEPLTALSHHMDLNWICEAYRQVRKNAATGIDGQTVAQYGENLVENLRDLQSRAKSGSYQAPPVKRAYVPKNEKEDRPIGIPTTEDKILQRAVSMILEPIYEQEFLPFSFGFRPGRSQHQALEYLREQCFAQKVQWILEVDLRKFFDTVDHRQMQELLSRRVQDGVITRLIGKWLQAIKEWGMEHRHLPMKEQQRKLNEKLRGHDGYYGVTGNIRMLSRLRYEVAKLWRRWLQRRNRSSSPNWERFQGMLSVFPLFPARIIHSKMQ
jgi:retron-type reverse transcriptase